MIITATGHRPNKLGGYGPQAFNNLCRVARDYLREMNPDGVISGLALGWDQAWAVSALELGIPVHGAVPFEGQENQWPESSQVLFRKIITECASVTYVCEPGYAAWKMQKRNEWMVERCHRVAALWDGSSGGTANCVKFAQAYPRDIDNLWGRL